MTTLEELERERNRLIARRKSAEEIKQIGKKRKVLKKEINELKHPKRTAFKKGAVTGLRRFGRAADQASVALADLTLKHINKRRKKRE